MAAETMRWYRSKVDWWLALVLCAPPLASIVVCAALALTGNFSEMAWGLGSALLVFGIYFGLVFPMRYGLDDAQLVVRYGVCRQRIPLADISEVYPTKNPLSAPALSLDRLHIQFGQGPLKAVMISPADRDGFLDHLAHTAGLKPEGERLIRVSSIGGR